MIEEQLFGVPNINIVHPKPKKKLKSHKQRKDIYFRKFASTLQPHINDFSNLNINAKTDELFFDLIDSDIRSVKTCFLKRANNENNKYISKVDVAANYVGISNTFENSKKDKDNKDSYEASRMTNDDSKINQNIVSNVNRTHTLNVPNSKYNQNIILISSDSDESNDSENISVSEEDLNNYGENDIKPKNSFHKSIMEKIEAEEKLINISDVKNELTNTKKDNFKNSKRPFTGIIDKHFSEDKTIIDVQELCKMHPKKGSLRTNPKETYLSSNSFSIPNTPNSNNSNGKRVKISEDDEIKFVRSLKNYNTENTYPRREFPIQDNEPLDSDEDEVADINGEVIIKKKEKKLLYYDSCQCKCVVF